MNTVRTRVSTSLTIVQTGKVTNTSHSVDCGTIIDKSGVVQINDKYMNRL